MTGAAHLPWQSGLIQIIYKADLAVNAPATVHIGDAFDVRLSGSGALDVKWGVKLGNQPVELDGNTGLLTGTAGDSDSV